MLDSRELRVYVKMNMRLLEDVPLLRTLGLDQLDDNQGFRSLFEDVADMDDEELANLGRAANAAPLSDSDIDMEDVEDDGVNDPVSIDDWLD